MRDILRADRVFCLLLMPVLAACARTPPEQAVRQQVEVLQHAIEARDAGAIDGVLAENFIGNDGMDKRQARQMAAALFIRYRNVGVSIGPVQVRMHGEDGASVGFTAAITGGDGGVLPESGQVYDVTTGWRLDGGDWRVISAEWKPKLQ